MPSYQSELRRPPSPPRHSAGSRVPIVRMTINKPRRAMQSLPLNRNTNVPFPLHLACLTVLALASVAADAPLPRAPALSPSEALRSFEAQDGFRLELLAAEPLVM